MNTHIFRLSRPKKSEVYDTYWKFAVMRNEVFEKRLLDEQGPWSNDPILVEHKFTNVFRAADRVSQYLIDLQYHGCKENSENVFFTTIFFKLFNKIETYQYVRKAMGEVEYPSFNFEIVDDLLTKRLASGKKVYSAAYIMPSAAFGFKHKHTNHLALLKKMMSENVHLRISNAKKLSEIFDILVGYPSLGRFLAFQYTIDLNYSTLIDFSEMDFVIAGPGAINGIKKCFETIGDFSYEDIIKWVCDEQETECARLGLNAPNLFGRPLQLVDCQNLFCEVDKYLRVSHPELNNKSGKSRIKQKFRQIHEGISLFFPPKWGINQNLSKIWKEKAKESTFL